MRVVSNREMNEIEQETFLNYNITEEIIIENVGVEVSQIAKEIFDKKKESIKNEVLFLIGKGNNAADAVAVARHLQNHEINCCCFELFDSHDYTLELQKQIDRAVGYGVSFLSYNELINEKFLSRFSIVIDGVLGTGFKKPLSPKLKKYFRIINSSDLFKIAIDIPSGIEVSDGSADIDALVADLTIAIGLYKVGHFLGRGAEITGEKVVINAGFPHHFKNTRGITLLEKEYFKIFNKNLNPFKHKNHFGHCLVVAGSTGMIGAAVLAAQGALKVGTGLVTVAVREECYLQIVSKLPCEVMTIKINELIDSDSFIEKTSKFSSVLIGPGLFVDKLSEKILSNFIQNFHRPLILDADALNHLAVSKNSDSWSKLIKNRNAPTVMTPHLGEFARLFDIDKNNIPNNTIEILRTFNKKVSCLIVLKNFCTVICDEKNDIFLNYRPNAGLSKAGSGDILAGMISGLIATSLNENLCQRHLIKTNKYVNLAVFIHSLAGRFAADVIGERAMNSHDILDYIPEAFDAVLDN